MILRALGSRAEIDHARKWNNLESGTVWRFEGRVPRAMRSVGSSQPGQCLGPIRY
jgi:hypothetical protein